MRAISLVALFVSASVWASTSVTRLQKQINAAGAHWTAGETSVSELPLDEFKLMTGLAEDEVPQAQLTAAEDGVQAMLPTKLDWRSRNGVNWVSPILNQGRCGSCVAFAAIATLETQYKIDYGFAGYKRLSPQHLFSCGGGSCFWGWTGGSAASFLQKYGVPDEACFPYTSGTTGSTGSCRPCADYQKRVVRITGYNTPTSGVTNLQVIKQALQKGPLFAMMTIYSDFRNYTGGVYRHVSGGYLGGHAISIVGYDDSQRALIIRNSWGTGWGENGFARVSYDDTSGIGANTWSYSTNGTPAFTNEKAGAQAEPQLNMSLAAGQSRAGWTVFAVHAEGLQSVELHWRSVTVSGSKKASGVPVEFTAALNEKLLPAGEYEVWMTGTSGSGRSLSTQRHKVFVHPN